MDGADLIVEAVVERPDVKAAVYAAIEAAAADGAVIATNTSSIPIAELAAGLRRPGRFLGVHWFVPPLLVPCVEVIPRPSTDEQVVQQVVDALTRLGKAAVVVGDGPGFVANRIQFAMFREAARIVEDGLATPEQVDEVVRSSFGFRLPFFGPFTIADMAGLDVYADIYDDARARARRGLLGPRDPGRARRPRRVRRQERPRVPRAVAGRGGRAGRAARSRVRRPRAAPAGGRAERRDRAVLPTQRLDGRHAIVTGAGRGIGRAVALALAEAGADVTLFSRSEAELAAVADEVGERGRRAETCVGDVRVAASDVERLVATAAANDGLSICVTAAGLNRPGPTLEQPIDDFDLIVETNLRGTYLTCRAFAAALGAGAAGGSSRSRRRWARSATPAARRTARASTP